MKRSRRELLVNVVIGLFFKMSKLRYNLFYVHTHNRYGIHKTGVIIINIIIIFTE